MLLVGFYRTILTLSMRAFGPRISAYAFWTTTDIHTYIPTDIPREISIEHPSVGLASLAQLLLLGKWFPLQGERAHSLNFCLFECMLIERKRRERLNNNYRAINFPRLYNSSQTTSPQPNTNFYHTQSIIMSTLYLYTYIIYYELFYSQRLLLK